MRTYKRNNYNLILSIVIYFYSHTQHQRTGRLHVQYIPYLFYSQTQNQARVASIFHNYFSIYFPIYFIIKPSKHELHDGGLIIDQPISLINFLKIYFTFDSVAKNKAVPWSTAVLLFYNISHLYFHPTPVSSPHQFNSQTLYILHRYLWTINYILE